MWPALPLSSACGRCDCTSTERVCYISSLPADAGRIGRAVRSHWEVENRLHWCLDVQFSDDYARARTGHVAHNLALVRHMALNLIRLDTSIKTSIKAKRLLAATSDEFRAALLGSVLNYANQTKAHAR